METASTEVTSMQRRSDIEKFTWRTYQYFVDFESRINVETSTSNRCHNSHVDSILKVDVVSTNFSRGNSTPNRWRIDEDESIGDVWKCRKIRSSPQSCSIKKLKSQQIIWARVSFLAILLKKRFWHKCFPVNFAKYLRTPFLQNTSGRLLPENIHFIVKLLFERALRSIFSQAEELYAWNLSNFQQVDDEEVEGKSSFKLLNKVVD